MSKIVKLLGAALIDGQIRYPIEGPLSVTDEQADALIGAGTAEDFPDEEVSPNSKAKPAAKQPASDKGD